METGIKLIFCIIILFLLLGIINDVNISLKVKNSLFNSVRSANQNSLLELNGKQVDDVKMLETWLSNFLYSYDLVLDEIQIDFLIIQDNPKVYVVRVKGYQEYCLIDQDTYFSFISASTIIND